MRYIFTQKGPHMLSIRYFFGRGWDFFGGGGGIEIF